MKEWIIEVPGILMCIFEGYCIQFFFSSLAEPKLNRAKGAGQAAGIVWILAGTVCRRIFWDTDRVPLVSGLVFSSAVLLLFCLCWYRGNLWLRIFMAVQFISLRELSFWAGYSVLYIGDQLMELLIKAWADGALPSEYLLAAVNAVAFLFVALVRIVQGLLLFLSAKMIVKSCRPGERGRMDREAFFYLLPAAAGVLIAVLVRLLIIAAEDGSPVLLYEKYPVLYLIIPMTALVLLGAIVLNFRMYQNMVVLQEERAEKIVLENQIVQMQGSMAEMEHLYDGIRSVRHDMKNHMAVLQSLIQKKYQTDGGPEDEDIRHYFDEMRQAAKQLETRVRTGNAVSDAVISSKFRYAEKKVAGIRLDADGFMLSDAVTIKAFDMGIILSNGLDNAVEACVRMREKQQDAEAYITLRSFMVKNMYFMEIENSFDGTVCFDEDSGLPVSGKEDKKMHGIGLRNVRKCAVKYGGEMDCIVDGTKFILSVMVKS